MVKLKAVRKEMKMGDASCIFKWLTETCQKCCPKLFFSNGKFIEHDGIPTSHYLPKLCIQRDCLRTWIDVGSSSSIEHNAIKKHIWGDKNMVCLNISCSSTDAPRLSSACWAACKRRGATLSLYAQKFILKIHQKEADTHLTTGWLEGEEDNDDESIYGRGWWQWCICLISPLNINIITPLAKRSAIN